MSETQVLIQQMLAGDRRSLSRLLSLVENQDDRAFEILATISPKTGRAYSAGITGPAGAGKSSLIDQLIKKGRQEQNKMGVVAVDPSSPFTGGAVLGDRVRMQRHFQDPDVFIRSIGSRGRTGGLSFATRALMQILDVFGVDTLLVETVGAGQSETDIADLVDTTVVVLVPEAGDSIQALKAGMLEIADIYVVNKKDRDGADSIVHDIKAMISMGKLKNEWDPPIVMTEARSGEGVNELWQAMQKHKAHLKTKGLPPEEALRRRTHELQEWVTQRFATDVEKAIKSNEALLQSLKTTERPNIYDLGNELFTKLKST